MSGSRSRPRPGPEGAEGPGWALPPLHLVTDDGLLAGAGFAERAARLLRLGGAELALHLRGPRSSGRLLYTLAAELVPVAEACGATLLVNDRLDVALAVGAAGVQLGRRGLDPRDARRVLGPAAWIGCSVHSAAEAEAVAPHADFLLVGTLYASGSHPGRAPAGPALLDRLRAFGRPMVGIGGINAERAAALRRRGAAGVAVQRAVWATAEPGEALEELRRAWGTWNATETRGSA